MREWVGKQSKIDSGVGIPGRGLLFLKKRATLSMCGSFLAGFSCEKMCENQNNAIHVMSNYHHHKYIRIWIQYDDSLVNTNIMFTHSYWICHLVCGTLYTTYAASVRPPLPPSVSQSFNAHRVHTRLNRFRACASSWPWGQARRFAHLISLSIPIIERLRWGGQQFR